MTLKIGGSRATEKINAPDELQLNTYFTNRSKIRSLSRDSFIERHASGTLRKNSRLGFDVTGQYLHERVAFEFGWCFEAIDESRVTWGQAISFPDEKALTEAGWFIDRYSEMCVYPGDEFETKYCIVEYPDGRRKEGVGLVCRKTSASFIPARYMVLAIIAEWNKAENRFEEAVNPC